MRFCRKCLETDTRPGSIFDEDGVCYPCRYNEMSADIDWRARRRELEEIAAWGKERNISGYDCIIPVSGGKDSLRQALYARDELGLRPLLVSCTYPPAEQTKRGATNLANLISLGFDAHVVSPGPETWKRLTRFCFERFGNLYKMAEMALYVSAPKVATFYNVPLVIYGENPALAWGSIGGSLDGDASRLKYSHTLEGGDLGPYLEAGFTNQELYWYRYPSDEEMERAELRLIYLGYYIPDFNDFENSRIAIDNGLEIRTGDDANCEETGQAFPFDQLDSDFIYVNQLLRHLKQGAGRAIEQISGAIRLGLMTREEGIELAMRSDGRCAPRYVHRFCDYLGIAEDEFWEVAERFRNRKIWEQVGNEWRLRTSLE